MKKKKALAGVGIVCVFGIALSACATQSDMSDLRAQMDSLSTRVSKVEKYSPGSGGGGSQLADMETRLDNQKLRIARLRDRMERINHRLDQLMNKIETQNAQLSSLGKAGANGPKGPATPIASPPGKGASAPSPAPSAVPGVAVVKGPSQPTESPDMIYHQAYSDYQQGHFDVAIHEFGSLVEQYPDSHLASSAVFWEAQSNYNLQHYHRALALYDAVIHKYVGSPKKATAYYKKGQVYEHLNDRKLAVHNYRRVLELFPLEQQLGDLAKRRLSRLDE